MNKTDANWRNPDWRYRPSYATDIRRTFRRIWQQRRQEMLERMEQIKGNSNGRA